ncbi:MAG: hypothetical protein AMXMBFR4_28710 [Candidatus Hydrogenedentota bacterium]
MIARTILRPTLIASKLIIAIVACDGRAGEFSHFQRYVIDSQFDNGYQCSVADINRDGRPDVIALSTSPSQLVWYRNPEWTRFVVTTATERNIDVAPHDVDGDGDIDLALAAEFDLGKSESGGTVQWLECPDDPTTHQEWAVHRIDAIPTSHRVRWADIDGDGKKELLNLPIIGVGAKGPEYAVGVKFVAYSIPANLTTDPWPTTLIDTSLQMAHGMCVVRWRNDDAEDLLTASFDGVHLFENIPNEKAAGPARLGEGDRGARPRQGSSEVGLGILKSEDTRFIATIEPWHGNQVVVYTPADSPSNPWTRDVVDDTFNDGHGLVVADLDGDGNDEIIAGYRGKPYGLFVYRLDAAAKKWERTPLDESGIGVAGLFIADLNADTRPDIVAVGTATDNVVWYENKAEATADPQVESDCAGMVVGTRSSL